MSLHLGTIPAVAPPCAFNAGGLEWPDIETLTGGALGEFDAPCPTCGPDRRKRSNQVRKVLRIWRSEGEFAGYFCARCGLRGWTKPDHQAPRLHRGPLLRALDPIHLDPDAESRARAEKTAFAQFVYFSAGAVDGTLADTYLRRRAVQAGADLRFAPWAPFTYDGSRSGPALVAGVRDPDGAIVGAHATYLQPDGSKLHRLCFGSVSGCAVRLAPVGRHGRLGIAEGIETALSFTALYGVPCWAALSAVSLERFEPPPGLSQLIVAADHDENGRGFDAAQTLAKRARRHCEVAISMPGPPGDWNDIQLAGGRS